MPPKTVYYQDPLTDDFAALNIRTKEVGPAFPFLRSSFLWRALSFLVYYGIAVPIVFGISKVYLGLRFENRKVLRQLKDTGYFLYGNHTRALDAFLPALSSFPKKAYVVANPDAVSLPFLRNLVLMLGVIPIPNQFSAMRQFMRTVSERSRQGHCIAIFPEAHIWPFCTEIRPFSDTSFRYPVRENLPAVAMVTTYRRRKGLMRFFPPAMTVTFSEPMYPDATRSPKKAQEDLRARAYAFMTETAATKENIAYIQYKPAPENCVIR